MAAAKPSSLVDTRVVYCGDNLRGGGVRDKRRPEYGRADPPFNSNRNYEVFWGETKEKRAFEDPSRRRRGIAGVGGWARESTKVYIDYMRERCVELALLARPPASLFPTSSSVLKKTGSFYYHCDWHASHYVKVMLTLQLN